MMILCLHLILRRYLKTRDLIVIKMMTYDNIKSKWYELFGEIEWKVSPCLLASSSAPSSLPSALSSPASVLFCSTSYKLPNDLFYLYVMFNFFLQITFKPLEKVVDKICKMDEWLLEIGPQMNTI